MKSIRVYNNQINSQIILYIQTFAYIFVMNQDVINRRIGKMARKTPSISISAQEAKEALTSNAYILQKQQQQQDQSKSMNSEWSQRDKSLKIRLNLPFPVIIKQSMKRILSVSQEDRQLLSKKYKQIIGFLQNEYYRIQKIKQDNKIQQQLDNEVSLLAINHALSTILAFHNQNHHQKNHQRLNIQRQIHKLLNTIDSNIQEHNFMLAKSNIQNLLKKHGSDELLREKIHYLSYIAKLSQEHDKQISTIKNMTLFMDKLKIINSESVQENGVPNQASYFKILKKQITICMNKENKKTDPSQKYIQFLNYFDRLANLISMTEEKGEKKEKNLKQLQLQKQLRQRNIQLQWTNEAARYCKQLLKKHEQNKEEFMKQLQALKRNKKKSLQVPYSLIVKLFELIILQKRQFNELTLHLKESSLLYIKKTLTLENIAALMNKSEQKYKNNDLIQQLKPFLNNLILNIQQRQRWQKEGFSLELQQQNKKLKLQNLKLSKLLQQQKQKVQMLDKTLAGQAQDKKHEELMRLNSGRQYGQIEKLLESMLKSIAQKKYQASRNVINAFLKKYQLSQCPIAQTARMVAVSLMPLIEQVQCSQSSNNVGMPTNNISQASSVASLIEFIKYFNEVINNIDQPAFNYHLLFQQIQKLPQVITSQCYKNLFILKEPLLLWREQKKTPQVNQKGKLKKKFITTDHQYNMIKEQLNQLKQALNLEQQKTNQLQKQLQYQKQLLSKGKVPNKGRPNETKNANKLKRIHDNINLLKGLLMEQQNDNNYMEILQEYCLKDEQCIKDMIECFKVIISHFYEKIQKQKIIQSQSMKKYQDQIYRLTQLISNHTQTTQEEILIGDGQRKSGSIKSRGSHPKQKQNKLMQKYVEEERVLLKKMEKLLQERQYEKKQMQEMQGLLHATEQRFQQQRKTFQKKIYEYEEHQISSLDKYNNLYGLLQISQHSKIQLQQKLQLQLQRYDEQLQALSQKAGDQISDIQQKSQLINALQKNIIDERQKYSELEQMLLKCSNDIKTLTDQREKNERVRHSQLLKLQKDHADQIIDLKMRLQQQQVLQLQKQRQQLQKLQQLRIGQMKYDFQQQLTNHKKDYQNQLVIELQKQRYQLNALKQEQIQGLRCQMEELRLHKQQLLLNELPFLKAREVQLVECNQQIKVYQHYKTKDQSYDVNDLLLKQRDQLQQLKQRQMSQIQLNHEASIIQLKNRYLQLQQSISLMAQQHNRQRQTLMHQQQLQKKQYEQQLQHKSKELMKCSIEEAKTKQFVTLLQSKLQQAIEQHKRQIEQLQKQNKLQLLQIKQPSQSICSNEILRIKQITQNDRNKEIQSLKSSYHLQKQEYILKQELQLQLSIMLSKQQQQKWQRNRLCDMEQVRMAFQKQKQALRAQFQKELKQQLEVARQKFEEKLSNEKQNFQKERRKMKIQFDTDFKKEKNKMSNVRESQLQGLQLLHRQQVQALLIAKQQQATRRVETQKCNWIQSNESYISYIVSQQYKIWQQFKSQQIQVIRRQHQAKLIEIQQTLNQQIIRYNCKRQQSQDEKNQQISKLQQQLKQHYQSIIDNLQSSINNFVKQIQDYKLSHVNERRHQEDNVRVEWQKYMQLQWQRRVVEIEDYWQKIIVPQRIQKCNQQNEVRQQKALKQVQERFYVQIIPQLIQQQKARFAVLLDKNSKSSQLWDIQNKRLLQKIQELQASLGKEHNIINQLYQKHLQEISILSQKQSNNHLLISKIEKQNKKLLFAICNKDRELAISNQNILNKQQEVKRLEGENFELKNCRSSIQYDLLVLKKDFERSQCLMQTKNRQVGRLIEQLQQQKQSSQRQFKSSEKQRLNFQQKFNEMQLTIQLRDNNVVELLNQLKIKQLDSHNSKSSHNQAVIQQYNQQIFFLQKQNGQFRQQIQQLHRINMGLVQELQSVKNGNLLLLHQIQQSRINTIRQFSHQTMQYSTYNSNSKPEAFQTDYQPLTNYELPKYIHIIQKYTNNLVQYLFQQNIIPSKSRFYDLFNLKTKALLIQSHFDEYFRHWQQLLKDLFKEAIESRFEQMRYQADGLLRLRDEMSQLIEQQIEASQLQDRNVRIVSQYKALFKQMKDLVGEYTRSKDDQQLELLCAILGVKQ